MADLDSIVPDFDPEREALGNLALCLASGQITRAEFDEWGRMLGLLPDPEIDSRPPTGHIKGTKGRLRAVPADWNRRGAVAG